MNTRFLRWTVLSLCFFCFSNSALASGGGGAPTVAPAIKVLLDQYDTDKSGSIDGAEFDALSPELKKLDQGSDDKPADRSLTVEELSGGNASWAMKDLWMCVAYAIVALFFSSICSVAEAVLLSVSPSYVANLSLIHI